MARSTTFPAGKMSQRPEGKRKRVVLRFLVSPVEIQGDGKVEKIVIGRNELVEEGGALDESGIAVLALD